MLLLLLLLLLALQHCRLLLGWTTYSVSVLVQLAVGVGFGALPFRLRIAGAGRARMAVGHMFAQRILTSRNVRTHLTGVPNVLMGFQMHTQVVLIAELLIADATHCVQLR
uniref:Secreted protein n=1 Tax=Anopheles darlingi TaxID=43151 RepID=A0A2M4DBD6_ANODA